MNQPLFNQYLIEANIVSQNELDFIDTAYPGVAVVNAIEQMGVMSVDRVYTRLADYLGVQYINLYNVTPSLLAIKLIPPHLLKRYEIFPLFCDHDTFEIATACPGDWQMLEELRFVTDRDIREYLGRQEQILDMLNDLIGNRSDILAVESEDQLLQKQSDRQERHDPQKYLDFNDVDPKRAAVTILNRLIKNAIYREASDMHVEPQKGRVAVRLRIDGELAEVTELPPVFGASLINRLKVLAEMDITKSYEPQDGSFTVQTKDIVYDLRVSSVSTPYGEKIVCRFLNPNQGKVRLEDLGLLPEVRTKIETLSRSPQGMIIVTGPTGSGKNTSMCSIINMLKGEVGNIVSVEDPIEYEIDGVNQIRVDVNRGITFAGVLRAILRQDPNVIYIGEIRDDETAAIACRAAQTGHMVFSTLHTNDSASAITRLLNMSIQPHQLADALTGVLAQRLTRRICSDCKQTIETTAQEKDLFSCLGDDIQVNQHKGVGCVKCDFTGYKGRIAVTELLIIDEDIKQMIAENRPAAEIMTRSRANGMLTMWETGLKLAALGITSIEEFSRHVPQTDSEKPKTDFPPKILVVDDEPGMLKACEKMLKGCNTEVITASDGDYALQHIRSQKPDFLLTDLNMPRVDGYTLCSKVRLDPATAHIPIIVMTGKGSLEEAECTSLELGANDFIRKPLKKAPLIARIRAVYRRHITAMSASVN